MKHLKTIIIISIFLPSILKTLVFDLYMHHVNMCYKKFIATIHFFKAVKIVVNVHTQMFVCGREHPTTLRGQEIDCNL